eukprot:9504182-Pyramimonas_sp.AAC.7
MFAPPRPQTLAKCSMLASPRQQTLTNYASKMRVHVAINLRKFGNVRIAEAKNVPRRPKMIPRQPKRARSGPKTATRGLLGEPQEANIVDITYCV